MDTGGGGILEEGESKTDLSSLKSIFVGMQGLGALFLIASSYAIPYGRYSSNSHFRERFSVPANIFWRCYTITWIVPLVSMFLIPGTGLKNPYNVLALLLYILHYIHRTVIYPRGQHNPSPWPLDAAILVITGSTLTSILQTIDLVNVYSVPPPGFLGFLGILIFCSGFRINVTHDNILKKLRRQLIDGFSQPSGYAIPSGGLFSYVSAANYLGEIIQWWGWALFTGSMAQVIFAITSTAVLSIRGKQHHEYYKKKFGKKYPAERWAVIPYVL